MTTRGTPRMEVTEERKAAFLAGYISSGGSWSHACRCASPHLNGQSANPPASQTWRNLLASNRVFAEAFEEAQGGIRDAIVEELTRRAIHGVETPVFQGGRRVTEPEFDPNGQPIIDPETGQQKRVPAVVMKKSDSALLAMARALLPEYADRKEIHVSVTRDSRGFWTIGSDDLAALSETQKGQLAEIMDTVRARRMAIPAAPAPAAIEHVEDEAEYDGESHKVPY